MREKSHGFDILKGLKGCAGGKGNICPCSSKEGVKERGNGSF